MPTPYLPQGGTESSTIYFQTIPYLNQIYALLNTMLNNSFSLKIQSFFLERVKYKH